MRNWTLALLLLIAAVPLSAQRVNIDFPGLADKAVETVDQSLARVLKAAEAAGTRLIVTADHGNAEMLIDPETGGPHTAHTTNPVPFVVIDWEQEQRLHPDGALCDVAPTILSMLGLPQPTEMTGTNLGVD